MPGYKLLNYAGADGVPVPGLAVGETVIDLAAGVAAIGRAGEIATDSTLAVLQSWDAALPVLDALAADAPAADAPAADAPAAGGRKLSEVRLMAPIYYPGAIYNATANYVDHQKEMNKGLALQKAEVTPHFFLKSARQCVIGPGEEIRLPRVSEQVDWEAELGVVIGRPARDLGDPPGRRFNIDWFAQKNFDGAGPMGPWIVPASDIPDPYDISIKLWVNDELMQESNTSYLFFNIHEQIEYLSRRMTLRPGDVIATGTPSGVGRPRGIFLKPGDTVTIELGGIGRLQNPVVQGD